MNCTAKHTFKETNLPLFVTQGLPALSRSKQGAHLVLSLEFESYTTTKAGTVGLPSLARKLNRRSYS